MEFLQRRSVLVAIAFIIGFSIGLFIFGWWLTPVQYTGAGPQDLLPEYQEIYIQMAADLYSHDLNQERVREAFAIWPEADLTICAMAQTAATEGDQGSADRLTTIALILNGQGCTADMQVPAEEDGTANFLAILLVLLLLVLLGGAIYYFMRMRNGGGDNGVEETAMYTEAPEQAPAAAVEVGSPISIPTLHEATMPTTTRLVSKTRRENSWANAASAFLRQLGWTHPRM
jgi:hypothetical protein